MTVEADYENIKTVPLSLSWLLTDFSKVPLFADALGFEFC